MSSKPFSFESFLSPQSLMAVLVLLGVVLGAFQYRSDRPAKSEGAVVQPDLGQDVEARLWHDPLQSIQASVKESAESGSGESGAERLKRLRNAIALTVENEKGVRVLPVMLSGGAEAEETESRLRTRYAVLSALGRSHFQPHDAEHLGWCRITFGEDGAKNSSVVFAYEWMTPPDPGKGGTDLDRSPVLVVWLNEREFAEAPLKRLRELRGHLLGGVTGGKTAFDIIGPRTTDGLVRMLKEKIETQPGAANAEGPMRLFSCWATTPDGELMKLAKRPGENVKEALAAAEVDYRRVIPADDELAKLLVNELRLRRILTSDGYEPDSIVLLTEWDTRYGRTLPEVFLRELINKKYFPDDAKAARESGEEFPILRVLSYQRGVDGDVGEQVAKTDDKNSEEAAAELVEKAVGRHQLDYVRRMIDRFDLRQRDGGRLAVGFLGSDVYDKLLLMQAVRERFPQALFFTTDADARYFHPSQAEWAGNLLIASGYGLSASDSVRKVRGDRPGGSGEALRYQAPPMRDVYQTATYLSVQSAIGRLPESERKNLIEQAEMFEVGRDGLVELCKTFHPERKDTDPAARHVEDMVRWILCGLPAAWLLFHLTASKRIPSGREATIWTGFALLLIAAAAGGSDWAYVGSNWKAEPWSLFDRVSIWPSELLRFTSVVVAVALLVLARRRIRMDRLSLAREYGLRIGRGTSTGASFWGMIVGVGGEKRGGEKGADQGHGGIPPHRESQKRMEAQHEFRQMFRRAVRDLRWQLRPWKSPMREGEIGHDAATIWSWYGERSRPADRALRVGVHWCTYLVLCGLLFWMLREPPAPARGDFSFFVDTTLQMAATLLITLLAAYVIDASLLSSEVMVKLARRPTAWPKEKLAAESQRLGVDGSFLDGWLDVHFAGRHTRRIGHLVYYPCITWFLLLMARWDGIDRWTATPGLITIYVTSAVLLLLNALVLHRSAEKVRQHALAQLKDKLVAAEGDGGDQAGANAAQLQLMIDRIDAFSEGAFTPMHKQPVVGALLMSFSGTSAFALVGKLSEFFG